MSRLITNTIRHTGASSDALTLDSSGNLTIPGNATCSGTATGFGKILANYFAVDTSERNTTSTSYTTASNTCSITLTPASTSSKFILLSSLVLGNSGASVRSYATIFRDSTNLGAAGDGSCLVGIYATSSNEKERGAAMVYTDSPNTTSSITYSLQFKIENASYNCYLARSGVTTFNIIEYSG
tara:strand:+ start:43 stop:591 length:549 start_codon:yes stop_codon:yes gene_type:complete